MERDSSRRTSRLSWLPSGGTTERRSVPQEYAAGDAPAIAKEVPIIRYEILAGW